jgi:hypothetical protein
MQTLARFAGFPRMMLVMAPLDASATNSFYLPHHQRNDCAFHARSSVLTASCAATAESSSALLMA